MRHYQDDEDGRCVGICLSPTLRLSSRSQVIHEHCSAPPRQPPQRRPAPPGWPAPRARAVGDEHGLANKRANELSAAAGLGDQLSFQVADALEMPFPDESFDLVWSLESGEHMPDKEKFVSELTRVLRPGGLFLVAWTLAGNCPDMAGHFPQAAG